MNFLRPASIFNLSLKSFLFELLHFSISRDLLSDIAGAGLTGLFWPPFMEPDLHIDRLHAAALSRDPFDFTFIPETLDPSDLVAIVRDFPEIPAGGSFDATRLKTGPAFKRLIAEMQSDAFRKSFEEKFELDLEPYPIHITVRGKVRGRDGGIHTDSKEKILTGLLYLNTEWNEAGGRLRLLRNGKDMDDYVLEVPPVAGNMVVFRRGENSWHGHLPSEGRRLSLQFNWVTDDRYIRRELARHRFSGWLKSLTGKYPVHV